MSLTKDISHFNIVYNISSVRGHGCTVEHVNSDFVIQESKATERKELERLFLKSSFVRTFLPKHAKVYLKSWCRTVDLALSRNVYNVIMIMSLV